eukprot:CAMPEP_0184674082 /NCGR_PEP_ID=MMETSP0308-20130426/87042_1 /TAXON_ID=38269 /ORGANISM="Gloeochaete witrockiana, Strain SAG 46.84" /LENGTH=708 /DNA_ID=CAMNT_0027121649 /DNA_START=129 /DNA_END=2255 /DNA_ORIENTATION=-
MASVLLAASPAVLYNPVYDISNGKWVAQNTTDNTVYNLPTTSADPYVHTSFFFAHVNRCNKFQCTEMNPQDYVWIAVIGGIFAAADAFGIGANDVANAFATSVGSRVLKLYQAVLIASVCEFLGALLLGASVTDTIRGGIIKATAFQTYNSGINAYIQAPELLMLLMQCALIGSSIWLNLATYLEFPVSTTHSIVGAIAGAGVAGFGPYAVKWNDESVTDISKKGIVSIVIGWFIAPVLAAGWAACFFLLTKYVVLVWDSAYKRALWFVPIFFFITFSINSFFIIWKGAPASADLTNMSTETATAISLGIGAGAGLIAGLIFVPLMRRRIAQLGLVKDSPHVYYGLSLLSWKGPAVVVNEEVKPMDEKVIKVDPIGAPGSTVVNVVDAAPPKKNGFLGFLGKAKEAALHGVSVDVISYSDDLHQMHEHSKKYDARAEALFSFLQVMTCAFASFAHGSNDVANAIGPFSAIMDIYYTGKLPVSCSYTSLQNVLLKTNLPAATPDPTSGKTPNAWEGDFDSVANPNKRSIYQTSIRNAVCSKNWPVPDELVTALGKAVSVDAKTGLNVAIAGSFGDAKVPVPVWILIFGGGMIVLGLSTWGYNIIRVLGNRLTYHSPSRGYSMELGATFTVLTASKLGLPVSTTQCITGATLGVGLMNFDVKAVNWLLFARIFFSWMITVPAAALMSGLVYGYATHTPNLGIIGVSSWRY